MRTLAKLLWTGLAACVGLAPPAQAQSMTFVMENFPPYIVDDKGQGAGPFPEVVRAVCASLKIACSFKLLPWRRAYAMADAGAVDGIFVLAHNAEREHSFHFTDPVFQSVVAVFARESPFVYARPADLDGVTVVTYGPSAISKEMQELAKIRPGVKLMMEIDNLSVLRKLLAGRYPEPAVAVMSRDVGLRIIDQAGMRGVKLAGVYKPISYAIGLSRKRVGAQQAQQFNLALRELIRQGAVKAIAERHGVKPAS